MFAYIGIGLAFGCFNWWLPDYQYWLTKPFGGPRFAPARTTIADIIALLSWVLPLIPIAVFESVHSKRPLYAALAGTLFWLSACASYYLLYICTFLAGGIEQGIVTDEGLKAWIDSVVLIRPWSHVGPELAIWTMAALYGAPLLSALLGWATLRFGPHSELPLYPEQ